MSEGSARIFELMNSPINPVVPADVFDSLLEQAAYAQKSNALDLLHEIYGKTKMAFQLGVITKDQFMQVNHETIYYINTHPRRREC